jgi:putative FmdB family regulatory protein
MPTYDYVCSDCGYQFEKFHHMSATPELKCPKCGGGVSKKIGAGAGLMFKGSGFYITDYKNKPQKPKENKTAPPAKEKTAAKSDS